MSDDVLYVTRALLEVLLDLAADADPKPLQVALAASSASTLEATDDPGAALATVPDDEGVLSDFYFPGAGEAITHVFGVDLATPPAQTSARFLSHPRGDPSVSRTDDLHARLLVAVPPWTPEDVRAYDRSGRRRSLVVVAANAPSDDSLPSDHQ